MSELVEGDIVRIDPLWNLTTRNHHRRFKGDKMVLSAESAGCESGIMVCVKDDGGVVQRLDSEWFEKAPVNE